MGKDPAMLWYWGDWAGGTFTYSRHLKGCYMDLLNAQFNSGHLSLDEIKTVLGADFGSWPALQKKFITDSNGFFFNVRLEEEKQKRISFTQSRKNNLSSHMGAQVKPHMALHMENENENTVRNKKGEKTKIKVPIIPFDSPHFKTLWEKWKEYRTEIGKPYRSILSEQAVLKMLSKYQCGTAMQMIEQSIANSWQGIFEIKTNGKPNGQQKFDAAVERASDYAKRYEPKP